jgi:large subunit ribosomal protein L31
MKPGIHPDYHPVVFQDATTGAMFLTRGSRRIVDSAGQVEKFHRRYGNR